MSYFAPRAAVAAACLVLAGFADLWFGRRPEPHSVAEFSPFSAKLGKEEVILAHPVSAAGPLLTHEGRSNEVVEIFFTRGSLVGESGEPQAIAYMTGEDSPGARGSACRTVVNVSLDHSEAAELRLF